MIDTHAHLDFSDFTADRDELIKECAGKNIKIINPGTDLETSASAAALARQYENVYAAVGLHPNDSNTLDFNSEDYKKLMHSKVVAIGETGLDFWRLPKGKEAEELEIKKQENAFVKQLELAEEFDLPVIIHCRVAFDEVLRILEARKNRGVIHCFSGTWEQAKKFLDLGFYLGMDGIIFKLDLVEVIKNCPLDKILLETDCPFLSPPGFEKRNSPLALPLIAAKVAEIKKLSSDAVEKATDNNAKTLFRL